MPKGIWKKHYSGEFKQMVIDDMRKNHLGFLAARFTTIYVSLSDRGDTVKLKRRYSESMKQTMAVMDTAGSRLPYIKKVFV